MTTTHREGRMRILRAARTLFLDRGFADVSMQQIADGAGITKATLYHHFRDKEDLYVEVVRAEHERVGQDIRRLIEGATSLEEELARIAVSFFKTGEGDFGRLAQDLYQHVSPELCRTLHDEMHGDGAESPERVIRACFARAIASGEIQPLDPDLPTMLFFSMIHGLRWVSDVTPAASFSEQDAVMIPRILLHGIAARAE